MPVESGNFRVKTKGFGDILDITPQVRGAVEISRISSGLVNVSIAGSTAAVTSIEYEPGVVRDLKEAIERLAPRGIHYYHDAAWGDGNGYAHVRAALVGASFTIPFTQKRLGLGTWQQVVLLDFDNRSRTREVYLQLVGE